jgi:hypothetical protein
MRRENGLTGTAPAVNKGSRLVGGELWIESDNGQVRSRSWLLPAVFGSAMLFQRFFGQNDIIDPDGAFAVDHEV